MKHVQNLSYKINTKRNSKSYNDSHQQSGDRLVRKAAVTFKLRKQKLFEEFAY